MFIGRPLRAACIPALVTVVLLAPFLAAPGPAWSRAGDGRLHLVYASGGSAGSAGGSFTLVLPAGGALTSPAHETAGECWFDPAPAGRLTLEYGSDGSITRSWPVRLFPDVTTEAEVDLASGRLVVSREHPGPFGDAESWDAAELEALPGISSESAARLNTVAAGDLSPRVDGAPDPVYERVLRTRPELENEAVAWSVPLGTAPVQWDESRPSLTTWQLRRTGGGGLFSFGTGERTAGQIEGNLRARAGFLGTVEGHAAVRGLHFINAGPVGISDDQLPSNGRKAVEARTMLFLRPGQSGLLHLDFHALGDQRRYFLQQYRLDAEHSPRQDRADLFLDTGYDFRAGGADLSLSGGYTRAFLETGDGKSFDAFDLYQGDEDNRTDWTADSLFWGSTRLQSSRLRRPHYFDYYLRELTSTWSARAEARVPLAARAPLRAGAEIRLTSARWYEHLNPISAANGFSDGASQYVGRMGYSIDGTEREDGDDHGPRRPVRTSFYLSQSGNLGPVAVEAGARATGFRSDQRPLKSLVRPLGDTPSETSLSPSLLEAEPSEWWIDPRLGLYTRVGGTHVWVDGGSSRREPPFEALYYSPDLLHLYAELAREGSLPNTPADFRKERIFGTPDLKPEQEWSAHAGLARTLTSAISGRASVRVIRTSDTWVARAFPAGGDSLNFYVNDGKRRGADLHLGVRVTASPRSSLRLTYDLAKLETNVIEPAPLYRTVLRPNAAIEGTGVRESAPLAPVWLQNGAPADYFPSLFDRRHRLAAAFVTRFQGEGENPSVSTLAATLRAASGAPYTPTYIQPEGRIPFDLSAGRILAGEGINSARLPWTWQIDVSFRRQSPLFGGRLGIVAECLNLTGRKNAVTVYTATGEPDDDGWLASAAEAAAPQGPTNADARGGAYAAAYRDRVDNPMNFDEGRAFRAAVSYRF